MFKPLLKFFDTLFYGDSYRKVEQKRQNIENRSFTRSVCRCARGNVNLQKGRIVTREDIQRQHERFDALMLEMGLE